MYVVFYEAIRDFFAQATWAGQPVPIVFASPDRAHQEIRRVLKRRRAGATMPGVSQTTHADEDRPAPAPFMSLMIRPPVYHHKYFSPSRMVFGADVVNGTAVVARMPRPIEAYVQVDLWCGTAGGHLIAHNIEPQIELLMMQNRVLLEIDWGSSKWYRPPFNILEHAKYFGKTNFRLYSNGWADTSGTEYGSGPKAIRRTWSGRMEGYLPHRAEEARLVSEVSVEMRDALTDELYGEIPVEA